MSNLILEPESVDQVHSLAHQVSSPLQVGQAHVLQDQAVGALKVLHCSKGVAAPGLHPLFLAALRIRPALLHSCRISWAPSLHHPTWLS